MQPDLNNGGSIMRSKFLNSLQSVSVLFTAVLVLGSATLYAQPIVTVVMSGLDNPRGLAFGPEGALYVAEAGRGPSDHSCFANPSQEQCTCGSAGGPVGCSG